MVNSQLVVVCAVVGNFYMKLYLYGGTLIKSTREWINVGLHNPLHVFFRSQCNAFQALLTSDGDVSYVIYMYERLEFSTPEKDVHHAMASIYLYCLNYL